MKSATLSSVKSVFSDIDINILMAGMVYFPAISIYLVLADGVAGKTDAEFFEDFAVNLAEHDG